MLSGMPPFANAETYTVTYDPFDTNALSKSSVLANDFDMEFDPLTAVLVSNASDGTVSLSSNGHFVYTPDENFTGTDSFTYKAYDGTGYSSVKTVTLNVSRTFSDVTNLEDRRTRSL